jgi:hypothetical protein
MLVNVIWIDDLSMLFTGLPASEKDKQGVSGSQRGMETVLSEEDGRVLPGQAATPVPDTATDAVTTLSITPQETLEESQQSSKHTLPQPDLHTPSSKSIAQSQYAKAPPVLQPPLPTSGTLNHPTPPTLSPPSPSTTPQNQNQTRQTRPPSHSSSTPPSTITSLSSNPSSNPPPAPFRTEQLGVDRRLLVNRKRQLKMYRVWVQGKFRKL